MRGKADSRVGFGIVNRITPAYAGKRFPCSNRVYISEDHPRLCGEKDSLPVYSCQHVGSPPPMRGKVSGDVTIFQCCRITPAYAGKSEYGERELGLGRDHPRLCGEKQIFRMDTFGLKGSPPPMRGKAHTRGVAPRLIGITPAYAGKSAQNASL